MERIESLTNSKVKLAASLAKGKTRQQEKAFVTEGARLCEEALKAAEQGEWTIRFGLITPEQLASPRGAALAALADEIGVVLYETPEAVYKKAAQVVSPQGVLFVVNCRSAEPQDVIRRGQDTKKAPLVAVLDGVQDPGNVGTILRTAEAVGATGAILLPGTADVYGDKTVRASMGAIFRLPIVNMTAAELLSFAADNGLHIFATALDRKARPHLAVNFEEPSMIVFGSEGNGVSRDILDDDMTETIFIPMAGGAESFNVAQASAIVLYETLRQREFMNV
ncbi:MAG: RNA methyltransferase [Selenomonadaceae bacterium]|nr:RNA methyltransferase [Selenomonadaceae bacterium]